MTFDSHREPDNVLTLAFRQPVLIESRHLRPEIVLEPDPGPSKPQLRDQLAKVTDLFGQILAYQEDDRASGLFLR